MDSSGRLLLAIVITLLATPLILHFVQGDDYVIFRGQGDTIAVTADVNVFLRPKGAPKTFYEPSEKTKAILREHLVLAAPSWIELTHQSLGYEKTSVTWVRDAGGRKTRFTVKGFVVRVRAKGKVKSPRPKGVLDLTIRKGSDAIFEKVDLLVSTAGTFSESKEPIRWSGGRLPVVTIAHRSYASSLFRFLGLGLVIFLIAWKVRFD